MRKGEERDPIKEIRDGQLIVRKAKGDVQWRHRKYYELALI
jgi:hypothetical protein